MKGPFLTFTIRILSDCYSVWPGPNVYIQLYITYINILFMSTYIYLYLHTYNTVFYCLSTQSLFDCLVLGVCPFRLDSDVAMDGIFPSLLPPNSPRPQWEEPSFVGKGRTFPIGSMYGICTYYWLIFVVNVGIYIYTPYMDPMGFGINLRGSKRRLLFGSKEDALNIGWKKARNVLNMIDCKKKSQYPVDVVSTTRRFDCKWNMCLLCSSLWYVAIHHCC